MKYLDFPYVRRPYQGKWTPENLAFNANLQDFAEQVRYISDLVNAGQLSLEEACDQKEAMTEMSEGFEDIVAEVRAELGEEKPQEAKPTEIQVEGS